MSENLLYFAQRDDMLIVQLDGGGAMARLPKHAPLEQVVYELRLLADRPEHDHAVRAVGRKIGSTTREPTA